MQTTLKNILDNTATTTQVKELTKEQNFSTPDRAWQRLRTRNPATGFKGDKVLIVGSSWAVAYDYEERKKYVESIRSLIEDELGLQAVIPDNLLDEPHNDHYMNTAAIRAQNEELATKDSGIKLIWNIHGGYGALESSPLFDAWRKKNPDALLDGIPEIGFSDVGVKLMRKGQAYWLQNPDGTTKRLSGTISPIHGPNLQHILNKNDATDPIAQRYRAQYIQQFKELFIENADPSLNKDSTQYTITPLNTAAKAPGTVLYGQVLGGHANRITASFGTDWEIGKNHNEKEKLILAVEADDGPELRNFITHLKQTNTWDKISAIVVANITPLSCRFKKTNGEFYDTETASIINDVAAENSDKPFFGGLSIGHLLNNNILPMLTDSNIELSATGNEATLHVNTFRRNSDITRPVAPYPKSPSEKFPHSYNAVRQHSTGKNVRFVHGMELTPINTQAKHASSIKNTSIVGGDLAVLRTYFGTSRQIDTSGKVLFLDIDIRRGGGLTLAGDSSSALHFSSLVKADLVRGLAHCKDAGLLENIKALVIGDIIVPSDVAAKSRHFVKYFNDELKRFIDENGITVPVYRASGQEKLHKVWHSESVDMVRTGTDNQFKLSTAKQPATFVEKLLAEKQQTQHNQSIALNAA